MAGRRPGVRGEFVRTYGRRHPVRKLQQQTWFSPAPDRRHLFSSSSSSSAHLSPTSNDDSDFLPAQRKKKVVKPAKLPAVSRKRKKSPPISSPSNKENGAPQAGTPGSSPVLTTPLPKFVTFRRKAAAVSMKPLSARREWRVPVSSACKKRRPCPEVISLLDSSVDTLPSPLQKEPLLSSTPSVLLTAMPRTDGSFVRQLALCEPSVDSILRCSSDLDSCDGDGNGDMTRLAITGNTQVQTQVTPKCCDKDQRSQAGSSVDPGTGVQCLNIRMSNDRSSLCMLYPVGVSSPECMKSGGPWREDEFCASAELFSSEDFSRVEEAPTSGARPPAPAESLQPVVLLSSNVVGDYFQSRPGCAAPRMRPVVQLDPHSVTRYFQQKDLCANAEQSHLPALPSPTLHLGMKTPLVTSSALQSRIPNSETTGRKVCISGFSAKRWGKQRKASGRAQQHLSFQEYGGDVSVLRRDKDVSQCAPLSPLLFSPSMLTSSFLNSTAVRGLDLSNQRDHQRWARLRAALSLHRRKKVEADLPPSHPAGRRYGNNSSLLLLSPFQSSLCCDDLTDEEKVLAECQQDEPIAFQQCLTQDQLTRCQKVGEGVYGEVFRTCRGSEIVALKVIPIEGSQKVNGEHQKSFAEILPEIIISKELSLLDEGETNRTAGFIKLHSAYCVRGSYPVELLAAWDEFAEEKGSENERPDLFGEEQLFMILEFEFGGDDLERMSCKLPSVAASRSILQQVTAALAVAEEELRFEHRDLHWGNLLIEMCSSRALTVSVRGDLLRIPSAGVRVKIIDYTLSRLDKDGLTVFCDLSVDEDLFLGEGDLQFGVYRQMREENQNSWSSYKPHSNVLWLHYLCDKLLSEVTYVRKPTSSSAQRELRKLRDFRRDVRRFSSATDVLRTSKLFN